MIWRDSAATRYAVVVMAPVVATGVVVLSRSQVIAGPLPALGWQLVVEVQAVLLAVAAVLCVLTLRRVHVGWRADGLTCIVLLLGLAASVLVGWIGGPVPIRVAAEIVAPLSMPALVDLAERRALGTHRRTLISAVAVGTLSIALMLVRDPFRDPDCWADCSLAGSAAVPSVVAAQLFGVLLGVAFFATAALTCGLAVVLVRRRPRSTPQLAVTVSAALTAVLLALTRLPLERSLLAVVAAGVVAAGCLLAALVGMQPLVDVWRRRELRRLAVALGDVPPLGTLESTLAGVLGDRELRVAYWLPESARYVDAGGDPVGVDDSWAVTLRRDGEALAAIRFGRPDRDPREVTASIGAAARLAIDNERLQAELLAQLHELRASRRRIIATGDETRRRVERTIHDVVQAELVAALYELAGSSGPANEQVAVELRGLIADVRDFAHGLYPSVLDAAGLPAALEALVYESPVSVDLVCRLDMRVPIELERTAYVLIRDAVLHATGDLMVKVGRDGNALAILVDGLSGPLRDDLLDRVRSLGGTIAPSEGGLRVELPCE